jgi:hypothetical protein
MGSSRRVVFVFLPSERGEREGKDLGSEKLR